MTVSEAIPLDLMPVPSRQIALGKLKSPARIMSGRGASRALIVEATCERMISLNESARWGGHETVCPVSQGGSAGR